MRAGWELRDVQTGIANYAACMAGPTGPAAWHEAPAVFQQLLRRRLVASAPGERPFEACVKPLERLGQAPGVLAAHRGRAWDFTEYGGQASDLLGVGASQAEGALGEKPAGLSLASLSWGDDLLARLSREAGPFAGEARAMLTASTGAYEAPHPLPPPQPALGRGLPHWVARYRNTRVLDAGRGRYLLSYGASVNREVLETRDGGVNWQRVPDERAPEAMAGACVTQGSPRAYRFEFSEGGQDLQLAFLLINDDGGRSAESPLRVARLGGTQLEVLSAACDHDALVAAVREAERAPIRILLCPFGGACRALPVGAYDGVPYQLPPSLDLARVQGATVVAVSQHGIVRITSSRDDGRAWTPFVVALDHAEGQALAWAESAPVRLLTLGERLTLYAPVAAGGTTHAVLTSQDGGASWHEPKTEPGAEGGSLQAQRL